MISRMNCRNLRIALVLVCEVFYTSSGATELIYVPMNPSFGGNPNNGVVLLNSANATNKHKDPASVSSSPGIAQKTALQSFNETLERAILGQLASAAAQKLGGGVTGGLAPGVVETGNFIIKITDLGGGTLLVTTTDKSTGAVTSFQVSQ